MSSAKLDRCLQLLLVVSVLPHYLRIPGHAKRDLLLSGAKRQEHALQSMMLQEAVLTFFHSFFPLETTWVWFSRHLSVTLTWL